MSLIFVIVIEAKAPRMDDRPVIVGPFPDADGPEILERLGNLRGAVREANRLPFGVVAEWEKPWKAPVVRPVTDDVLEAYEALTRFRDAAEAVGEGEEG